MVIVGDDVRLGATVDGTGVGAEEKVGDIVSSP